MEKRHRYSFGPVRRPQLPQYGLHMSADGFLAHNKFAGDGIIRKTFCDKPQDLTLSARQCSKEVVCVCSTETFLDTQPLPFGGRFLAAPPGRRRP